MFSKRAGIWPFLALAIVLGITALLAPRADLPPSYHHFADQRIWLGIPHFGDVASNIAFLIAGLWGLAFFSRKSSLAQFVDARYTRGSDLLIVAGFYVLAKVCETADHQIFSAGHLVSGHTLKHISAGAAGFWILGMLQKRRAIEDH